MQLGQTRDWQVRQQVYCQVREQVIQQGQTIDRQVRQPTYQQVIPQVIEQVIQQVTQEQL